MPSDPRSFETPRRLACGILWMFSLAIGIANAELRAADPPRLNVILIVADDLGGADLGCYGSTFHKTPHLDQLAAEGVRFSQAYAACPVCSPSRAALMTGKWPARLNLTTFLPGRPSQFFERLRSPVIRKELPLEEQTLAELLQAAGYATAHIGKWHLGGEGFEPTRQGFKLNIAGNSSGSPPGYFAPFRRGKVFLPGLEEAPEGEYLTDRLTSEAVKFIQAHREQPFFLYLPHYTVHIPLQAKADLIAKYPEATPFRGAQNNPVYAAMLESLDEGVGRLRATLKELQIDDRTVIIFTSDNGGLSVEEGRLTPATSNAPFREAKGFLYEGGIRVPLIVHGPGLKTGAVSTLPTSGVDMLPTVLELCALERPAEIDGVSVASELTGQGMVERDALYWHFPHYSNQGGRPGGAIRAGNFKLIEFYETGRRELFDLSRDAGESRNLVLEQPEVVERLGNRLAAWLKSVEAQMPTANPDYVPNPPGTDGRIVLQAKNADVQGVMLRYEPMPHKNTLGYWVRREDTASWLFQTFEAGSYEVEALVGCGNGSGGSRVEFQVGDQTLTLDVEETGGFQNFVPRKLGRVTLDKARYTLTVTPKTKPGVAVMDLREVTLTPVR